MTILDHTVTAKDYADLCKVSVRTIYYRHKKKRICSMFVDGYLIVDINASPPMKREDKKTDKPAGIIRLPDNINYKSLVAVRSYAQGRGIKPDIFYEMAIMGKITAVVMGGMLFVLKAEADQIRTAYR
jgi:hypothetical protein